MTFSYKFCRDYVVLILASKSQVADLLVDNEYLHVGKNSTQLGIVGLEPRHINHFSKDGY
jgi:hypothetical protein